MQEMVRWAVNGGSDETVEDVRTRLRDRDLRKTARAALDAFMNAGVRGVARVLVTGPDDWAQVDAMVSLGWLLAVWDRYAISSSRELLRESFHASAQKNELYTVLVDLLGRGLESHDRLYDRCMLLVVTMTGNLSGTFASVGSARAVDSNIHRLARTALAEASNGRIGSHLLASLANDMSTNIAEEYALTALLDLTYTPYTMRIRPPNDSALEPMTSTSAALAADENIEILFQMFGGGNAESTRIRNAALRVLSNVLYYNNVQTEPSPLLEQIRKTNAVATIMEQFRFGVLPNATAWLRTGMALTFLERFLFALKRASEEVLDAFFDLFERQETAFVPTMLAHWKGMSRFSSQEGQQIRLFSLFGHMDERYKPEARKWQRALTSGWEKGEGVYAYLETTLKGLDPSRVLNNQSVTVHLELLKYTLLPHPELWKRARADEGLLNWMIDTATFEPLGLGMGRTNQHTLHYVLGHLAARDSGVAEWMLSNNGLAAREHRLLHFWAPKREELGLGGHAKGFRALLCHGAAFDLVTTHNAQRGSGAPVHTAVPEKWEQWDWDVVELTLKDPKIIALAAKQKPGPSVLAALLITIHILHVLEVDPEAEKFEGPKGESALAKLVRRNGEWDALLGRLEELHAGDGQLQSQFNHLAKLVTELLHNPGPSNSAFILSKRQGDWEDSEEAGGAPKRLRTTTTDAVYARFLDLAQLRL